MTEIQLMERLVEDYGALLVQDYRLEKEFDIAALSLQPPQTTSHQDSKSQHPP